jgi:hypothetical protein
MSAPESGPIVVDASSLAADAGALDLLARLQLAARRLGGHVLLRDPSADLEQLIAFAGLDGVLRVEARRQAEQREQLLGAEEERQLLDPPV